MPSDRIQAYYVVSTHWDREWYESFQQFRYHLVELLDELFEVMEADERFTCFQTDGQSIILEDYLEIRPERAELVRRYAQQGRLRIGPWYTMPDENLPAPESLVRNLEEGIRVARGFGNVSLTGFVCDIFGHVSQLPQILRQFGINSAFLFRGVNEDTHGGAFRWFGADGSEVVTHRFGPREGYSDFGCHVRRAFKINEPFDPDECARAAADYVDLQRERMGLNVAILFDGTDHLPIEPQIVRILDAVRKARPDVDVHHVGLDEVAETLWQQRESIQRRHDGELRETGRLTNGTWLIPGVLASRIRLTQDNRARESELCYWAEPMSILAERRAGQAYPYTYIRRSWRYLLENHAHDSICGCSPDQVHKDMGFRFDQARMINNKVIDHALQAVARRVDLPDLEGEQYAMVVFNPTQSDIDGPVDLELWFDENTKNIFGEFFNYESKIGFRLYDAAGNELPYDYIGYKPFRRRFHRALRKTPMGQECIVVSVSCPLKIPAFGYTTIVCKPQPGPTRHPAGNMVRGDRAVENEHLRVEAQTNGSLKLIDKRNGTEYDRLLVFEERADIGDGWYHGVAVNDQVISSTAAHADVAVVADGAQKATLRITNRMRVPEKFDFDRRMCRSDRHIELVIVSDVTLRPGAEHLEITTTIDNNVRDHRVRVLFETGADTDTYVADAPFDVVTRKIGLPADNHTYKELAVETTPHTSWTAAFDKGRGLAVVAPDLPETTVRDVPERTLALTLLRGFRRTVFRSDDEPGGQSLGHHAFHYCLVPLAGEPPRMNLARLAQRMTAGVRAIEVLGRDQAATADRNLPPTHGQLNMLENNLMMTSYRRHPERERIEIRVFNPYDEEKRETFRFDAAIATAESVDFDGNTVASLSPKGNEIAVTVGPKKIVTLALSLGKPN